MILRFSWSSWYTYVPQQTLDPTKCTIFYKIWLQLQSTTEMSKEAQIQRALAHLNEQKQLNYAEAARTHGVNPSTLWRRHKGISVSREQVTSETHQRLSSTQEDELLRHIDVLSKKYISPIIQIVRNLVKEILQTEVRKNWIVRFIKRHSKYIYSIYLSLIDNVRVFTKSSVIFKYFYTLV